MNWGFLIDETTLAAVVPEEHARFRRPIAAALTVFLEELPPAHQAAVLAEQTALSPRADLSERLAALARACPALHKLGQVLARDRRFSPELRRHLQELESLPPTVPLETMERILVRELGPLDRLGVTLQPPALAEASVAVVLPFRDERGRPGRGPCAGVFKMLKPGIEERLAQELDLIETVGAHLDQWCEDLRLPHLDYRESFEQVADKLRHEVRLDQEQRNLEQARAAYAGEPRVQIPELFEHCTPRVTAMERVLGGKVTEHAPAAWGERRRLAGLVIEALLARPIFSRDPQALFHRDPHAGNLFLTPDGRLAILDWSLVGSLGERERAAVPQILLGALTLDAGRIATTLAGLAEGRALDPTALESVVGSRLGEIRRGEFPGFGWLLGLLDEAVQTARLRVRPDLLLFRKALHMLEGVAADVGAGDRRITEVVVREFLRHLVREWPQRWLAPPGSRAFVTRLSNADLFGLVLGLPWAVTRFWLGQALDLIELGRSA
jgi:ubiquinone biosynthesis protein